MTTCKLCGTEIDWLITDAHAKGYDPAQHCGIKASQGVVAKCLNWLDRKYCESCPMARGLFKEKGNKTK